MNSYEALILPIETGLTAADHQDALRQFIEFTALPENEKERIVFPGITGREHNTHAGYVRKEDKDNKQLFHYTQQLHASTIPRLTTYPKETRDFINTAQEILISTSRGLEEVLREINPIIASTHFPPSGVNNHHLRFVLYDDASAAAHYDQSTVTVAMCETAPGLRMGTSSSDLIDYVLDPNESVMFLGYGWLKMHKILGITTEYLPAWHDVLVPEAGRMEGLGRAAMILFANPAYIDTSSTKEEAKNCLGIDDILSWEEEGVLATAA